MKPNLFASLTPLILTFLLLTISGCAACGKTDTYRLSWIQPGLFEKVPANGEKEGYQFEQPSENSKIIQYENAREKIAIRVNRDNFTSFTYSIASSDLQDDDLGRLLNETFQTLELGAPQPERWDFEHKSRGCFG